MQWNGPARCRRNRGMCRPGKLVTAFDYPCQVLTGPVAERFPKEILEVLGTNPGEKHLTTQEECV